MVIIMKSGASAAEIAGVVKHIETVGMRAHLSQGEERTIIGMVGDERPLDQPTWSCWPASSASCRSCAHSSWPAAISRSRTR